MNGVYGDKPAFEREDGAYWVYYSNWVEKWFIFTEKQNPPLSGDYWQNNSEVTSEAGYLGTYDAYGFVIGNPVVSD